ncbi:SPOR domain-containing protein, partial [Neisseria sp. P0021.S006]
VTKDKKAADQLTAKQKERAERKLAEKKAAEAKKQNKPTPEQILNSGSIEKARKAANTSATKESSNSVSKQSTEKAETAANSGKKAFLQLGSYADRSSADSQRAKLAILGVSSRVVESQNGDKTIYRVQSNTMPQEAAIKLQKNLQGHNINSLIRSSK